MAHDAVNFSRKRKAAACLMLMFLFNKEEDDDVCGKREKTRKC